MGLRCYIRFWHEADITLMTRAGGGGTALRLSQFIAPRSNSRSSEPLASVRAMSKFRAHQQKNRFKMGDIQRRGKRFGDDY